MKAGASLVLLTGLCLLVLVGSVSAASAAAPSSVSISPAAGSVGSKVIITGKGFAPNVNLALEWTSANVTWVLSGNPTQISDIKAVPTQLALPSVVTDASGSFTTSMTVPVDYGGKHFIQAFNSSGTAIPGQAIFTVEPSFTISNTRGPAGTPITVSATGLGYGLYSTNYHIMWDNKDFGYMTAVTTHGVANATFYAVGSLGAHYIDIYQGYPGAAYLNPQENPSPGNWFPPLLPYHATFTITSDVYSQGLDGTGILAFTSLGLVVAAFASTPILALKARQKKGVENGPYYRMSSRAGVTRTTGIALVAVALVLAGGAIFLTQTTAQAATTHTVTSATTVTTTVTSSASASTSKQQAVAFPPQEVVVRPHINVQQTTATSGPRITATPDAATVGSNVTINGAGFTPNSQVPVSWSSRQGNNLNGFKTVNLPLRNVTTKADGSFSFNMKVPYDLEGIHFVSVANLTRNSNATFYVERSAAISSSSGPEGSTIVIKMTGVGWSYITNIAVLDYDNSYVGYGCGFNSQGNVTLTLTAAGAPGVHSIDLYPSIWLGPQSPATPAIFRYPLMTPYDHPGLSPSFHFSYVITSAAQSQGLGGALTDANPSLVAALSIALGCLYLALEFSGRLRSVAKSSLPMVSGGAQS